MRNVSPGGATADTGCFEDYSNSQKSAQRSKLKRESSPLSIRDQQTARHMWTQAAVEQCKIGGADQHTALLRLQESLPRTVKQIPNFGAAIDNQRVQQCLGILAIQGKVTPGNIPDIPDRSMFSCARYQFFLDAPFEISNICCREMKKHPIKQYSKETGRTSITAQTAEESRLRTEAWLKNGCNAFDAVRPISNPMSFWTEQDILRYIHENNLPIASVYGDIVERETADGQLNWNDTGLLDIGNRELCTTGISRTGCSMCMYGYHLEKPKNNRIINILKYSNPKIVDGMLRGGHFDDNGLWKPHHGLGYWFIFEWCNKYGNMKYWYPDREYYINKYSSEETDKWLRG